MKHLIVAAWQEDLSWLKDVPDDWTPFIVAKDYHIPNMGREASSYAWALERLTVAPTDVVAFCQGDPFVHGPHFIERLYEPLRGFTFLGDWIVECDKTGRPNHPDLDVGGGYERWVGGDPPSTYVFCAGAQWMMPASYVLQHSREYYNELYHWANEDESAPWVLERLWPQIFSRKEA